MPGAGLEPARAQMGPRDFKSLASAVPPSRLNFSTRVNQISYNFLLAGRCFRGINLWLILAHLIVIWIVESLDETNKVCAERVLHSMKCHGKEFKRGYDENGGKDPF